MTDNGSLVTKKTRTRTFNVHENYVAGDTPRSEMYSDIMPAIENVEVNLTNKDTTIDTMKQIESAHWDYLDNYRDYDRYRYRNYNIYSFTKKVFAFNGKHDHIDQVEQYVRQYNRYKKSLPTAGVLMYYVQDGIPYFIVIQMKNARIWSMPKGKKDTSDENLAETAVREFREETGIDVCDFVEETTPTKVLNKTRFYILESDDMGQSFHGYNQNEIAAVRWISCNDVMDCPKSYSKQTVLAASYLMDSVMYR